jgi:hypothetical protein
VPSILQPIPPSTKKIKCPHIISIIITICPPAAPRSHGTTIINSFVAAHGHTTCHSLLIAPRSTMHLVTRRSTLPASQKQSRNRIRRCWQGHCSPTGLLALPPPMPSAEALRRRAASVPPLRCLPLRPRYSIPHPHPVRAYIGRSTTVVVRTGCCDTSHPPSSLQPQVLQSGGTPEDRSCQAIVSSLNCNMRRIQTFTTMLNPRL